MKFNDAILGAALVVFAALVAWQARGFPDMPGQSIGPRLFPTLVAAAMALCGIALVISGARHWRAGPVVEVAAWVRSPRLAFNFLLFAGGIAFYALFSDDLGFLITTPLVLAAWLLALGARWFIAVPLAIAVVIAIHTLFYLKLGVALPWGLLTPYAW